ncbi:MULTISPECIES: penicillin-binding protein 1A [unclassified Gilliamella]|uniref:penicillin-binding protein 1A n=1 Tax=unclassified Gilliamella TaxID=2685620 RepID=UPI001C6A10C4|nr:MULTISPECIES: PBP1A family penicillin-binding protein [unclassified Gilliamella]MCX8601028.1 PBP1A family penicillin-binding protein [Gilliamella sp. B3722]MCX8608317.1 PBP1A family penicillin-binding protein [Gilliamella sp. B3771]MCX8610250.1 PBP1A family penicillin-binding protein [Gilliamella sp. B3891]MCX8612490.1 PBP1A family penicillin-binding protein [Gilliamella sp. B3773]MCX8616304.1 PBP1A family penicillin-binding protein [Gilliamella sp. B3770]
MILLKILKFFLKIFFALFICGLIIGIAGYAYYSKDLPDVATLKDVKLQTPMQVLSKDGELIAIFGERRRTPLQYNQIPPQVVNAVIATEDARFNEHFGIDPIGIMRAMYIGVTQHGFSQGGSTITQQVAKNFFLTPEKSIARKVKEMILAIRMEKELSKEEIMTLYLNMINFGSRAYGVGAASYTFFGKTPDQLTVDEAALLAGLPNAPSAFNPIAHPERALTRRNWVLGRMLDQSYITQAEYDEAIKKPLNVSYHEPQIEFSAPYVAEMARQFMYDKFGENAYTDGYKVYTTISKTDQVAANEAVQKHIVDYDIRHGYRGPEKELWQKNETPWNAEQIQAILNKYPCHVGMCPAVVTESNDTQATAVLTDKSNITINFQGMKWARRFISDTRQGASPKKVTDVLKAGQLIWVKKNNDIWELAQIPAVNAALVSLDSDNGAIKAIVGGYDFNLSKFNRATQALRQLGSNIKPFIYTSALEQGLTMATLLNDAPIVRTTGSVTWRPKNSPPTYAGPLRMRIGLGMSKNVMMVRALRAVGLNYAATYLERFGFPKENISYNESLALGSASFTPLQVARAYSVIVNGGYLIKPYLIERIEYDDRNDVIYQHQPLIACHDCDNDDIAIGTMPVSLDNVENESNESGNEEPEQANLNPEDNLILPDINGENSTNVTPKYAPHTVNSGIAFIMKDGLRSIVFGGSDWNGTAWRVKALGRKDVGGKTGTTNASKDVWFSGFGGNIVTTVWMGFDDHRRELGRTYRAEAGAVTANPVWVDYMKVALQDVPVVQDKQPANVVSVTIDQRTGLLPQSGSKTMSEYFIKGTEPTTYATQEVGTSVTDSQGGTTELF